MQILYIILAISILTLLLVVVAVRPSFSKISLFELERLANIGNKEAKQTLGREKLINDFISLQGTFVAILLVGNSFFWILAFGWLVGIAVALFVALFFRSIARLGLIKLLSQKIYDKTEKIFFRLIRKHRVVVKLLRGAVVFDNSSRPQIESHEELQHLITKSGSAFSVDDKNLIVSSLDFNDRLIKSVMTSRDKVISINKNEFLGPLALNDLHQVGHSRLPVINGNLDHIIGILNLKNLLTLDTKKSTIAEKAMEPKAYYIRENQTLYQGIVAFSHTHQHLLVVINETKETVGVVVLKDIIEALLGRKIVDEFDDYDDIRAVATRK